MCLGSRTRHLLEHYETGVAPHEASIDAGHVYSLGGAPLTLRNRTIRRRRQLGIGLKRLRPRVGIAKSESAGQSSPRQPEEILTRYFSIKHLPSRTWACLIQESIWLIRSWTSVHDAQRLLQIQARLVTANLSFNNEHLILIRQVSQAYFSLLRARGLREAAEVSLNDARTSEAAAQERRKNGLATVPEVLEAKAATAKAAYDLQSAIGAEQVEIGNLARAITTNPLKPLKVEPLDQLRIPDKLDQSVEDAIKTAFKDRPDLQADQARVRAAQAEVKHAHASYYPSLTFDGSKGWIRAFGQQHGYPGVYAQTRTYDATLGLKWTVFDGFLGKAASARRRQKRK